MIYLPAIKGKVGLWRYYSSIFTYQQISDYVKDVNDELHRSRVLSDMIQRSITSNYKAIADYILEQKNERFFNSLVLATYDGNPKWLEAELEFDDQEFVNIGVLSLNGSEKIFPVDGQHRVRGIKEALMKDPTLGLEEVPVILVAHNLDEEGMQRSRRLFSTLNRYAKPISMRDIVALDEDDIAAIATRHLLENTDLFPGRSIFDGKTKAISRQDKRSFTSIITLYRCNRALISQCSGKSGQSFNNLLKRRPTEQYSQKYISYCENFWDSFLHNLSVMKLYCADNTETPADSLRNLAGGNILFRPVVLEPFIRACLAISERTQMRFSEVLTKLDRIAMNLDEVPWLHVLWNKQQSKMQNSNSPKLIQYLVMYMMDPTILDDRETQLLQKEYANSTHFAGEDVDYVLSGIPTLQDN